MEMTDYPQVNEQARQDAILAFIQCERTHRKIMNWLHNVSIKNDKHDVELITCMTLP